MKMPSLVEYDLFTESFFPDRRAKDDGRYDARRANVSVADKTLLRAKLLVHLADPRLVTEGASDKFSRLTYGQLSAFDLISRENPYIGNQVDHLIHPRPIEARLRPVVEQMGAVSIYGAIFDLLEANLLKPIDGIEVPAGLLTPAMTNTLRLFSRMDVAEVADKLGTTVSSARYRLDLARRALNEASNAHAIRTAYSAGITIKDEILDETANIRKSASEAEISKALLSLTDTEKQILTLSSEGLSVNQISKKVGLDSGYVSGLRSMIMTKTLTANIEHAIYVASHNEFFKSKLDTTPALTTSKKQLKALFLFSQGKTKVEIANEWSMDRHAVDLLINRASKDLGAKTAGEAIRIAVENKLFESYVDLTSEFAQSNAKTLAELASLIPQVDYTEADILADRKGDRTLHGKWSHGLVVVNPDLDPIAFVGAYEREAEGNHQYPANTLYISELAVSPEHQGHGVATDLMRAFFAKNDSIGLQVLSGELNYSLQTNSAPWNQHVVNFYKSLGFQERVLKKYEDRTDIVLGRDSSKT